MNDSDVFMAVAVAAIALLACWLITMYQREESDQESVDIPAG